MTDQIQQARRAAFEAWAVSEGISITKANQSYTFASGAKVVAGGYFPSTSTAWEAFNAGLDSLCIELPKQYEIGGIACDAHDRAVGMCRAAIEHTNMGIKIK